MKNKPENLERIKRLEFLIDQIAADTTNPEELNKLEEIARIAYQLHRRIS